MTTAEEQAFPCRQQSLNLTWNFGLNIKGKCKCLKTFLLLSEVNRAAKKLLKMIVLEMVLTANTHTVTTTILINVLLQNCSNCVVKLN